MLIIKYIIRNNKIILCRKEVKVKDKGKDFICDYFFSERRYEYIKIFYEYLII